MEALPLHPQLVHLPIALALLMPLVSAGLLFAWTRDLLPRKTWIVAVLLQAVLVASGVAAMRSGEEEEERVEEVVAKEEIHEHEEAAEAFVYTAAGVLLLFVASAAIPSPATARTLATAAAAGTFVVMFLGYRTGEAGGQLVYEHGAAEAYRSAAAPQVADEAEDDHDEH